jgi:hypothetical protein
MRVVSLLLYLLSWLNTYTLIVGRTLLIPVWGAPLLGVNRHHIHCYLDAMLAPS